MSGVAAPSLISILGRLGLTTGLVACLDAGDGISTNGTSQTWTDRSGNTNNYFRGADNTVTTDDPTFNGTAGALADSAYWSFDGGDSFTETTNQTWADGFHTTSNKFTLFSMVYPPGGIFTGDAMLFINGSIATGYSIKWLFASDDKLYLDDDAGFMPGSSNTAAATTWTFCLTSLDEAGGAAASFHRLNTTVTTFNGDMTNFTPTNAPYRIGGEASGDRLPNGTRMSMFAAWNGVALSQTQAAALYAAIKATRHTTLA